MLLHHSPLQTIGGAVRGKQTAGVSWKLSKLDHLLLGCSRMMFLLFKFTSKVPNNAKQLGRTATAQQGLEWLLMWIRLHYPAGGRRGVDAEKVVLYEHQGQCLKCHTSAERRDLSLINFQRFLLSVCLKASLVECPPEVTALNKCITSLKISSISTACSSPPPHYLQ